MKLNQTYREKLMLFVAMVLLLSVLAYKKSIKNTLEVGEECKRLRSEIANTEILLDEVGQLHEHYQKESTAVSELSSLNHTLQQIILSAIDNYAPTPGIVLEQFEPLSQYQENGFIIKTQAFTVEGDFIESLRFLNHIDTTYQLSKVNSVQFYTTRTNQNQKPSFHAKIYLQKISKA